MQNTELQAARDRMETLLENYTDLYDSPGGLFLPGCGSDSEVNLTGAALLDVNGPLDPPAAAAFCGADQPADLSTLLKRTSPDGETSL